MGVVGSFTVQIPEKGWIRFVPKNLGTNDLGMNFVLSMDLYCIVDAEAALMDGYLWKRSHESIKAAIVGSFTVQIPRMDEMPHSIGKFVKRCSNINLGVNHFMTPIPNLAAFPR